jgi:hypothetical protein
MRIWRAMAMGALALVIAGDCVSQERADQSSDRGSAIVSDRELFPAKFIAEVTDIIRLTSNARFLEGSSGKVGVTVPQGGEPKIQEVVRKYGSTENVTRQAFRLVRGGAGDQMVREVAIHYYGCYGLAVAEGGALDGRVVLVMVKLKSCLMSLRDD